jgi:hypothetical protein
MEETNSVGILFDKIQYNSPKDFEKLISELNEPQSFYVIQVALEKSYNSGIFTLQEAEILSKSLRMITKPQIENEI